MQAHAVFSTGPGHRCELTHGAIVGRLHTAALQVDDPRVSEAHALLSLRGESLKLLALRGRLRLDGVASASIVLARGQVIELAPALALTVLDVVLPESVVGLEGDGLPRQPIDGVRSLFVRPRPRLDAGAVLGADAVLWGEGARLRVRLPSGEREVAPGDTFEAAGRAFRLVTIPLRDASVPSTVGATAPLRLVASFDTVQIHQNEFSVVLGGLAARIISELIALGGPAAWNVLAAEIWGANEDGLDLRPRFDMAMNRLRRRLREAGIRDDLVVLTGTGQAQLVLHPGDRLEDRI
jgi:hypothetical protein